MALINVVCLAESWVTKGPKVLKRLEPRGRGRHGIRQHPDSRLNVLLKEADRSCLRSAVCNKPDKARRADLVDNIWLSDAVEVPKFSLGRLRRQRVDRFEEQCLSGLLAAHLGWMIRRRRCAAGKHRELPGIEPRHIYVADVFWQCDLWLQSGYPALQLARRVQLDCAELVSFGDV